MQIVPFPIFDERPFVSAPVFSSEMERLVHILYQVQHHVELKLGSAARRSGRGTRQIAEGAKHSRHQISRLVTGWNDVTAVIWRIVVHIVVVQRGGPSVIGVFFDDIRPVGSVSHATVERFQVLATLNVNFGGFRQL
jgi:hypothetical protein